MHALVQLATRKWLESRDSLERWKRQFISNLCGAFPTGEYENWATCQALFAHTKSAVGQQLEEGSLLIEWATLLYRAAWYAEIAGNIADAVILAEKSLEARKKVLGLEHDDTLWSMALVGSTYKLRGRWKEAEKLLKQVIEKHKKKLGLGDLATLASMRDLASIYWS